MHNFWDEKENSQGRLNETINFFKVRLLCCLSFRAAHCAKLTQLRVLHAERGNSRGVVFLHWGTAQDNQSPPGVMI